jgi:hypothetical protein
MAEGRQQGVEHSHSQSQYISNRHPPESTPLTKYASFPPPVSHQFVFYIAGSRTLLATSGK